MSRRILIVDDSPVQRFLLKHILTMCGEDGDQVLEAPHGAAALTLLEHEPVDAVLCDINMPVMGGLQLVRELRARPALCALPIIVITSDRTQSVTTALEALGVEHQLTKPVRPEMLRGLLRDLRPRPRVAEAEPPPPDAQRCPR